MNPTRPGRWQVAFVAAGVVGALVVWLLPRWWREPNWLLAALAVLWLIGTLTQIESGRLRLSLEDVALCSILVIGGPGAAVMLAPLGVVAHLFRRLDGMRKLMNLSTMVLSIAAGAWTYDLLRGPVGYVDTTVIGRALVACAGAVVAVQAVSAVLMATGIRVLTGQSPAPFLRRAVAPTAIPHLMVALAGVPLAAVWLAGLGMFSMLLIIVPLLTARWALQQVGAERAAQQATMRAFIEVVEAKDVYTRGHSERVRHGAGMVGRELDLSADDQAVLENAGLLHDCGKVGIPLSILRKPGRLTDEEMDLIRLHPARGVELMGSIPFLEQSKVAVLHHHEKWDGSGYPAGLRAIEIPYYSRIIGIVDAFDCLTSTRSYRAAKSIEEALAILEHDKLTHFDPTLVDVFTVAVRRDGWDFVAAEEQPPAEAGLPVLVDHDDLGLSLAPGGSRAEPRE